MAQQVNLSVGNRAAYRHAPQRCVPVAPVEGRADGGFSWAIHVGESNLTQQLPDTFGQKRVKYFTAACDLSQAMTLSIPASATNVFNVEGTTSIAVTSCLSIKSSR